MHDLFVSNELREELQKKSAASHQTLPSSQLPSQIETYHSLVPLDTTRQRSISAFGYPSWVYKVQDSRDGNFYVLRRLEGFLLTNDKAIRAVSNWKRVVNASTVGVHNAFTTRLFGDSSLIVVTDYHPLSKTLAEHHFSSTYIHRGRHTQNQIPEQILWSYMTQIASALKTVHSHGLAARVIDASKILLTGKNRIRLNGCAVMDVVQPDALLHIADLQRQDLKNFGLLMLSLGAHVPDASQNPAKAMDQFSRHYGPQLREAVIYLYSAMNTQDKSIDDFITLMASPMITSFDSALRMNDQLNSEFARETENARLFRLITKLDFINDRPEIDHGSQWSESGEKFFLKLFREYLFHQIDGQGNPVVDLGHVLTCLNKLDAGSEERVMLVTRDEQHCYVVSYKELKKAIESAFQELIKKGRRVH